MRIAALLLPLVLCGCYERYDYTVATEERPYIARWFDRDHVAKVECGRFTDWKEVFYLSGHEVTREEYFSHLQKSVGLRLAAVACVGKAQRDHHYREYVHVDVNTAYAMQFWERQKTKVDDPAENMERYREKLRNFDVRTKRVGVRKGEPL